MSNKENHQHLFNSLNYIELLAKEFLTLYLILILTNFFIAITTHQELAIILNNLN